MTCIRRPGVLLRDSDSSDSEDLPVFAFTQSRSRPAGGTGAVGSDVLMVSSDSEEEPMIPLAVRLRQKQLGLVPESRGSYGSPRSLEVPAAPCSIPEDRDSRTTQSSSAHNPPYLPKDAPPAGHDGAYPAKRKKTPAEVEASRQEALKKRATRELQMKEKERLRLEKKAQTDAVKALKPEECIKHIVVTVDPGLLQLEGGGALLSSLHAMGCSCAIEKQSLPRSVTWARRSPCAQTGEMISVPESFTVVQVPVEDFVTMTYNFCKKQSDGVSTETGTSLTSWTRGLMSRNPGRTLSLVVIDIEKYFKSQNSKCQKKYREEVLSQNEGLQGEKKRRRKKEDNKELREVSRVEVEEALVDLQLHTGVQVRFLPTWKDFTDFISMSTKAVAEAPFKRDRENTGFTFCLESEWSGGQKVDRAGNGLLQVWKRQIQQLNRVSPDMASAILSAYPSPQLLAQAYARCRSEQEKMSLLSDLLIRRGEGVTSTTRRVGPELSKRLFLLMTSADAQQPLDSVV